MTTIRAKTHIPYTITIAIVSIPLWAALWIAIKVNGDIGTWRPWLLLSHWNSLNPSDWDKALWGGATLGIMTGAGLAYLLGGMVLGVTATDAHGDARWATGKEIHAARLVSDWGLVLGKLGKAEKKAPHLRAHTDDQGTVLVSGPPRSGKGVGIIVPTLLDYPGSLIVYDVKGELFETTARRRLAKGDSVRVLSPFDVQFPNNPDGSLVGRSHSFNPLIEIAAMEDLEDRLVRISEISSALLSPKSSGGAEASLMEDAHEIFEAAAAVVCNEPEPSLGRILQVLTPEVKGDDEIPDYKSMFAALAPRAPDPVSKGAMLRMAGQDNKQLGIYLSVLMGGGLNAWRNPAIVRATKTNDFDFEGMRWKPQTCYISIPESNKQVSRPLVRLFIQCAINALRRRLMASGEDFLPVLFLIDEFHSLGRMQGVLDAVTTLPGYGGRLCLVVQSPASLREHYGPAGEEILTESSHLHVWLTPNSEETKQKLSKALGNKTVTQKSVSGRNWSKDPGRSESWSEKSRALLTPEEIGRLGKEEVIITGKGMFPIRTNRVSFYKDHRFKALNDSQTGKLWPDVPVVKSGVVTRYDEFLKDAGSSNTNEPETTEPVPEPKRSLSQRAAVNGVGSPAQVAPTSPRPPSFPDQGTAGYGFFEDPREVLVEEETQEDRKLTDVMETIKAPDLAGNLGSLLNLAPINPETDRELAELAHRLSPDELINRLSPLFRGGETIVA
ncbi:type IV secretory system conjugative DNA transfer family protein [Rhodobacteraceae bacterium B1Z28]|uniref:Type IV secretory system conjugative DNA transfer family protein n=1 Tax=Ruegeria haliotis TaxID=2747601 RepID=A0ABX2PS90_9RHOB|nr:type IV secretory system conjugative DNA transfer family protein [Ruegeria haliotis]NVO57043.1 type IV secretory system conjugative DNA transfer family protein [Ruegeria haliotis]